MSFPDQTFYRSSKLSFRHISFYFTGSSQILRLIQQEYRDVRVARKGGRTMEYLMSMSTVVDYLSLGLNSARSPPCLRRGEVVSSCPVCRLV